MKRIYFGIIAVLVVIGTLISGCSSDTPYTPSSDQQKSEPEKTVVQDIFSMNEDIRVDYLTYRITKAETFTEMGSSLIKKETNGKFVKVYLDVLNDAKETKQIFTPRFKIVDGQGRNYDRLSDDMMYISDAIEFGEQLQPGLKVSGAIVFEMPKDSVNLQLIITGDWLSTSSIKINLNNIADIGKDTTLKEETDKKVNEMIEESGLAAETNENSNSGKSPYPFKSDAVKDTVKGITVALDDYTVDKKDGWGELKTVRLIIDNQGSSYFSPSVKITIYNKDLDYSKLPKTVMDVGELVETNEYLIVELKPDLAFDTDIENSLQVTVGEGLYSFKPLISLEMPLKIS